MRGWARPWGLAAGGLLRPWVSASPRLAPLGRKQRDGETGLPGARAARRREGSAPGVWCPPPEGSRAVRRLDVGRLGAGSWEAGCRAGRPAVGENCPKASPPKACPRSRKPPPPKGTRRRRPTALLPRNGQDRPGHGQANGHLSSVSSRTNDPDRAGPQTTALGGGRRLAGASSGAGTG